MVLTLKFDKNSQRYITFNLQRLSRTVLVYHFKQKKPNILVLHSWMAKPRKRKKKYSDDCFAFDEKETRKFESKKPFLLNNSNLLFNAPL